MARYRRNLLRARHRRALKRKAPLIAGAALVLILAARTALPAATTAASSPQSLSANEALGRQMAAGYGWTGGQWNCLYDLWMRESGWNAWAANPTSDARGIPQNINGWAAYPPGAAAPQIAWGLTYVRGRYGSPCAAWSHEESIGWY
jgi:resuscitation-promoting factor RpfB